MTPERSSTDDSWHAFVQMETAVRLLFPGELGKHAVSEGRKAVLSGLG